ncbi:MAG TPA: thymidylate synthase [Candidatus Limnocylindria bacterium]|nr:thymidylate synthase [Candidatus Limnocylindria bacterium]
MIAIKAASANDAWHQTMTSLYDQGQDTGIEKYFRDEMMVIEVANPIVEPADPLFPMQQTDLDVINRYMVTGQDEDKVAHEWTKLYYHRAFDEPNSQVEFLLECLSPDQPIGEAQISMWDKAQDQHRGICPCTQIVWARIKHGKLELHVHTNSSDAYKKLLMNMLEFIALHHYLAKRAGVQVGSYYHILDSCHFYGKDKEAIERTLTATMQPQTK